MFRCQIRNIMINLHHPSQLALSPPLPAQPLAAIFASVNGRWVRAEGGGEGREERGGGRGWVGAEASSFTRTCRCLCRLSFAGSKWMLRAPLMEMPFFRPLLLFLSFPLFAGCSEKDPLKRGKKQNKKNKKHEVSFARLKCFASRLSR